MAARALGCRGAAVAGAVIPISTAISAVGTDAGAVSPRRHPLVETMYLAAPKGPFPFTALLDGPKRRLLRDAISHVTDSASAKRLLDLEYSKSAPVLEIASAASAGYHSGPQKDAEYCKSAPVLEIATSAASAGYVSGPQKGHSVLPLTMPRSSFLKTTVRGLCTSAGVASSAPTSVLVFNLDGIVVQSPAGSRACEGMFCPGLGGVVSGKFGGNLSLEDSVLLELKTVNPKLDRLLQLLLDQAKLTSAGNTTLEKSVLRELKAVNPKLKTVSPKLDQLLQVLEDQAKQSSGRETVTQNSETASRKTFWKGWFEDQRTLALKISRRYGTIRKSYLVAVPILAWISVDLDVREVLDLLLLRFMRKMALYEQEVLEYRQLKRDSEEAADMGLALDDFLAIKKLERDAEISAMLEAKNNAILEDILAQQIREHETAKKRRLEERDAEDKILALLYDANSPVV